MYYNPTTKEKKYLDDLKVLFNASIPNDIEEINGWYLIIDEPSNVQENQRLVRGEIEFIDSKYIQQYIVEDIPEEEITARKNNIKRNELERELEQYKYVETEIILGLATKEDLPKIDFEKKNIQEEQELFTSIYKEDEKILEKV